MQPKYDVLTIGRVSMDLFAQNIGAPFEEITGFDTSVGGSPTNIAIGCSRLGLQAALLTAVGDDMVGRLVVHRLRKEGVDTSYIPVKPGAQTGLAIVGVQPPDRFPLTFYRLNAADVQLTIEDADAVPLNACRTVLLSGTALARGSCRDAIYYVAAEANRHGVTTVMDLDLRRDQWGHPLAFGLAVRSLLSDLSVIIGTEEEFYALWGSDMDVIAVGAALNDAQRAELDGTIASFLSAHAKPEVLVVKCGGRGVRLFSQEHSGSLVPGFKVDVVNTVGAGDAFASGVLYGRAHGWNWLQSARFGNACGAIVVTRNGCSQALPYENEVLELLATTPASISDRLLAK
jgi:5-dehydro-2-deoxygluconokinase